MKTGLRNLISWAAILWLASAAGAAESQPALLSKLIQGAKAEKEFNLVGGGGTWGDAEAQKSLSPGIKKESSSRRPVSFISRFLLGPLCASAVNKVNCLKGTGLRERIWS